MTNRPYAWLLVHAAPWGPIHLAATERGLTGLAVLTVGEAFAREMERGGDLVVADGRLPAVVSAHLDRIRGDLDRYLCGPESGFTGFTVALDIRTRSDWDRRVLDGVRSIPLGRTLGYGELALRIGSPGAARAVGGAVGRNRIGIVIPCHRVVAGDGSIGGYGGDWGGTREERLAIKRTLLRLEGVVLPADERPDGALHVA